MKSAALQRPDRCQWCRDTHDPAYDCLSMDALITSLRPQEWEWGPIGDNTLAYCNWARRVARRDGEEYHDVFVRHRDEVERRWRDEVSHDGPKPESAATG